MSTVTQPRSEEAFADVRSDHHHLAHHFESPQQQFDAGKLGMWIFLVTEVLFFSGLFVAYAVYRSNHPEVFIYAHQFLDKTLGTINTLALILSSLTMAWGVRCAQLQQQRGLVWCLGLTLACAGFFLGVKAVEYSMKWDEGLLWAGAFAPTPEHRTVSLTTPSLLILSMPAMAGLVVTAVGALVARGLGRGNAHGVNVALAGTCVAFLVGVGGGMLVTRAHQKTMATHDHVRTASHERDTGLTNANGKVPGAPRYAGIFFSIYYAMTGVHALHILAGMGVLTGLLWQARAGRFGSDYFGPIDYFGLYWHLVDLVWIFLFPLLYLIH